MSRWPGQKRATLSADRPEVATRIMIATADWVDQLKAVAGIAVTGRKAQRPVLAYSLAWHPNEAGKLDRAEMSRAVNDSLRVLRLERHQAVIVAHRDTAQYPDPETREAHVVEKAAGRAQAAQERQEAASGPPIHLQGAQGGSGASKRPQSQAVILREIGAATKERQRQEWVALRGGYATQKAEIASGHKGRTCDVVVAHKRDTKPEWAAQFRGERDGARDRPRMERRLVGRLSLSIAAAREQHREQSRKVVQGRRWYRRRGLGGLTDKRRSGVCQREVLSNPASKRSRRSQSRQNSIG